MYDAIIIGAGPAGLNAGLYLARSGYQPLILESTFAGGQVSSTFEVDNYLGFDETIDGATLVSHMKHHAEKFGVEIRRERVTGLSVQNHIKQIKTAQQTYNTPVVILAMGTKPRPLGVPGESKLRGLGVSYCATCDGAFFKNRDVAVVGGGDTALEDALFLANYCKNVHLIHRRDTFRAVHALVNRVLNTENIHLHYDSVVTQIGGSITISGPQVPKSVCRSVVFSSFCAERSAL